MKRGFGRSVRCWRVMRRFAEMECVGPGVRSHLDSSNTDKLKQLRNSADRSAHHTRSRHRNR